MKRIFFALSIMGLIAFNSCKDKTRGETDHDIKIEDTEKDTMLNPGSATRTGEKDTNTPDKKRDSTRVADLHKRLQMTPEQLQRLDDLRDEREELKRTPVSQQETDDMYKNILTSEQYTKYEEYKKNNPNDFKEQ